MRLLENAEIKDVLSLISNKNSLKVKVNFYQRPYRWTAKKVTNLFEDYKENRLSALHSGENCLEYFIGAVVLVDERSQSEKDNGKVWKYQVVDGQQRFTTLFLFNYIKYLLLIKKVDEAARMNRSRDFNAGLESMEQCYEGFIGDRRTDDIRTANRDLSNAFDTANQNRVPIDIGDLNTWRMKVGWIQNPDISDTNYYEDCCKAMLQFLQAEDLKICYENTDFNKRLKKALSQIVIKFSDASDASFCDDDLDGYDENDETKIEFPYVLRAYGIFDQVKKFHKELYPQTSTPYDKLCGYISLMDEMLGNIKLCMIVTSDEDDAYKLFETLNDRSESVNDLELLKNYFFKTYTETSGDRQDEIYTNIASLDKRWRNIFFSYEQLEAEIFEDMTVLFTGDTGKNTNEKRRKLIKRYLSEYGDVKPYSFDLINRDFTYMEYIKCILLKVHRIDGKTLRTTDEDSQMSLFIENDARSSVVKRALGLSMNIPYPIVAASIICDIIHNYVTTVSQAVSFDTYLNEVFDEEQCKQNYTGLWKDSSVMWRAVVLSRNFESPKLLSDVLATKCNIKMFDTQRNGNTQLVQFDANIIEEKDLVNEFKDWIEEWKFSDGNGKLKIKNLFMHMFLKYDYDKTSGELVLSKKIIRSYAQAAIRQDLDHMDARTVGRSQERRFFHYNLSDRSYYTNGLGNMMPLPVAINRGKHNKPMEDTIDAFKSEGLVGWIFDMATELFNGHHIIVDSHKVPNEQFFTERKKRLIDYFVKVAQNQKFAPDQRI